MKAPRRKRSATAGSSPSALSALLASWRSWRLGARLATAAGAAGGWRDARFAPAKRSHRAGWRERGASAGAADGCGRGRPASASGGSTAAKPPRRPTKPSRRAAKPPRLIPKPPGRSVPDDQPRLERRRQVGRAGDDADGVALAAAGAAVDLADEDVAVVGQALGVLHQQRLGLLDFA